MENLSDIFPVIIFLFWVIFGVIFKSVAKNRAKPVTPAGNQDSREDKPPKKRSGTNLKDALQMVLEEMDLTERRDDQLPESIPKQQTSPEAVVSELTELVSETAVDDVRSTREKQPYRRSVLRPYQMQKDDAHKSEVTLTGRNVDGDEIRRGIIWSEILSPPLSLREPR